jgi:hypothetical protein
LAGGRLRYFDTYQATLYSLKPGMGGPTDGILYVSNMDYSNPELTNKSDFCRNYVYNFYCENYLNRRGGWGADIFTQSYRFGPLSLASTYGVGVESWLGENILMMKPPDVGQVNSTYRLRVPEGTRLRFSASLRPDTWHPLKGDGVEFRVLGRVYHNDSNNRPYAVLFDKYADPKNNPEDRKLFEEDVDVSSMWGQESEIVFQTLSGPNNSSMYDTAGWGNPRLVAG